jgi:hypothetical protein
VSETLRVAEKIMRSAQRDLWALADAVLTDVPALPEGRPPKNSTGDGGVSVADRLNVLAGELEEAEVVKADGTPYSPGYLRHVRDAAMTWEPEDRQAEASFEAHRENAGENRNVFLSLCAHARGEKVRKPAGLDPDAWRDALDKVATQKRGFKVQTQAVRMATGKRPKNTPTVLTSATFTELCNHIAAATGGIKAFAADYDPGNWDTDDRKRMARLLDDLIEKATFARDIVGVSVEDLAEELRGQQ